MRSTEKRSFFPERLRKKSVEHREVGREGAHPAGVYHMSKYPDKRGPEVRAEP